MDCYDCTWSSTNCSCRRYMRASSAGCLTLPVFSSTCSVLCSTCGAVIAGAACGSGGQGGGEENTFDTDEFDSTPHEWKGQGEPEENVFENWEKEGGAGMEAQAKQVALAHEAAKGASGARQAALARVYAKAEEHAKQRDQERGEQERQLEAKLVEFGQDDWLMDVFLSSELQRLPDTLTAILRDPWNSIPLLQEPAARDDLALILQASFFL